MIFISIDPGTSTCGVAIWELDDNDFTIKNIDTFTITIDKNIYLENRIYKLYKTLLNIMNEHKPLQLVHESGFMDRFRPHAYGPIYTTIYFIRMSFKTYKDNNDYRGIFQYPPKHVKSILSKGTADKDDMLTAVSSVKELQPFITTLESEHEIDAIAIGYTHLLYIRETPEILLV